jgi:hypothetical protein
MLARKGQLQELAAWLLLAACVWLAISSGRRANAQEPVALAAGHCVACGHATDAVSTSRPIDHRGRRVAACSEPCAERFAADPDALFARFETRGAWFDEPAAARRPGGGSAPPLTQLLSGWFWFGAWIVLGLIGAAWSAYLALSKGLAPLPWLLRGLAFNLLAVLAVALKRPVAVAQPGLAKIATTAAPVDCRECGGPNHPAARRCVGCGAPIETGVESEARRALRKETSS